MRRISRKSFQSMKKFVLGFSNKKLLHYSSHLIIHSIFCISVKYQYYLIFLVKKLENFSKSYHPSHYFFHKGPVGVYSQFINKVVEGTMSSL